MFEISENVEKQLLYVALLLQVDADNNT